MQISPLYKEILKLKQTGSTISKLMLLLYNVLQLLLLATLMPLLVTVLLVRKDARSRIMSRLGFGLQKKLRFMENKAAAGPIIWIHALSVGEVTSALPLIKSIKNNKPEVIIFLSVATKTGIHIARTQLSFYVDCVLDGPLDFIITIKKYVRLIHPSIFILVETDFWPNWLAEIQAQSIPSMLVNGRISAKSFSIYRKFSFFVKPMFASFSLLSLQTNQDAENMKQLGMPADRITTLGNLKYDPAAFTGNSSSLFEKYAEIEDGTPCIWVCGSTHRGEEEIILRVYAQIAAELPNLFLIIAPRDINRAAEIKQLAEAGKIKTKLRSHSISGASPLLILDTLGELGAAYMKADVAFVGGSLVRKGGHNPLEPAAFGVPTLFGPFMEDFHEIAAELTKHGGAASVKNETELAAALRTILTNREKQAAMAQAIKEIMKNHQGVTQRHFQEIDKLLQGLTTADTKHP